MGFIEAFQEGFDVPLLGGVIVTLFVARLLWRGFWLNLFPSALKEKNVDSIYYTLCITFSVSLGEYVTWDADWREDYDGCYRGWPNQVQTE